MHYSLLSGAHNPLQPDLPKRFKEELALTEFDANTFYTMGSPKGYIDYPFAEDSKAS